MKETINAVTLHGNPVTLVGPELKVGDKAPDFEVSDNELKPKTLKDFSGKALIISSVPSLGVLIKELRLLARAVFVLDKDHIIRHIQIVREIAEEPDYDAVLAAAKGLV